MKKNRILAMGLSAALLCTSSAFAAKPETVKVDAKPLETKAEEQENVMVELPFMSQVGEMATVKSVQKEGEAKSVLVKTEKEEIQLNVDEQTLVVNNETGVPASLAELKAGDKVFVYYSPAMTRSLPPQAACELILVNVGDKTPAALHEVGAVTKDKDGKYAITTQAGDMVIRIDDKTAISDVKTKNILKAEDLTKGTRFLAWYDLVAMSYPGQAYTEKQVVLPATPVQEETSDTKDTAEVAAEAGARNEQKQEDLTPAKPAEKSEEQKPAEKPTEGAELTVVANGKTLAGKASMKDGKAVIAVREVAEALGCKVSYAQEDGKELVTIENDTRKMTLEIGKDLYISAAVKEGMVGMTAPATYGVAPYIVDGKTYAPADLFQALVGFDVVVKDGTVTISAKK